MQNNSTMNQSWLRSRDDHEYTNVKVDIYTSYADSQNRECNKHCDCIHILPPSVNSVYLKFNPPTSPPSINNHFYITCNNLGGK